MFSRPVSANADETLTMLPLPHSRGERRPRAIDHPFDVRLQNCIPAFRHALRDRSVGAGSGIVHQDIQASQCVSQLFDRMSYSCGVADIGSAPLNRADGPRRGKLAHRCFELCRIMVDQA